MTGAPSIGFQHEVKDNKDIRDAFHELMLERGAPPTQASVVALQTTWTLLEGVDEVSLMPPMDYLYEGFEEGRRVLRARDEDYEKKREPPCRLSRLSPSSPVSS